MNQYRADLHIHSVLSPCASLDMSPSRIVEQAVAANLNIIGITDHNATLQCALVQQLAAQHQIYTLLGAEVTTREEIHCLVFLPDLPTLQLFQDFLQNKQNRVAYNPEKMGYQLVVDENELIMHEVDYWLHTALSVSINELQQFVHSLQGIFIPAHIDRPRFSLTSQLGFIPPDLVADAFEISQFAQPDKFPKYAHKTFIRNSDAHFPELIGSHITIFEMNALNFEEIKMALRHNSVKI